MSNDVKLEQAVMVCPQCEGEGGYPDGLDESACHTDCTRCGGNGWIVDLAAWNARHQPQREAVLEQAVRQALLQIEKYAEFFCEEDFDPLVDQLRTALTTPAPAVSTDEIVAVLEPFAKAAAGVAAFDPDYPMDGAALRASFDWYDKAQDEPLKRHSVRRSDLERARAILSRIRGEGE